MNTRIALGSASFGMPYGISNTSGRVSEAAVAQILAVARAQQIDTIDTAIAYGDSEDTLGRVGVGGWNLISKVGGVPAEVDDVASWMRGMVKGSLSRLNVPKLHGLLLHDPEQLTGPKGQDIADALKVLQSEGLTDKIGYSIYDPNRLPAFLQVCRPDIVQAPFSILDRRIVASGWAKTLKDSGAEVHTRSAFLQGLLLMTPQDRPPKFAPWSVIWDEWSRWLEETDLSALEACLRFVSMHDVIDRIVVGVDKAAQLAQILQMSDAPLPSLPNWPDAGDMDIRLINPSHWNSL
ncbi:aldo/keto reductase [Pseudogemmobacter sp. W21_MBD1_M6]|uniref:aldo/keto reductase n=1 Tax=Pseudogemmobacter sp. W21_MBD1_M6 TaxID=3240271 RepID=UPI003F98A90C